MKAGGIGMRLANWLVERAGVRVPDFVIGGDNDPYLLRWWVIPRNRFFNVYLHLFLRSDDDRALHDHPWANCSILLRGSYTEHEILAGGVNLRSVRKAGEWRFRLSGRMAHRVELHDGPCWTLFITGPRYRQWGFHCERTGWVHWKNFTTGDGAGVGKGCDQ
jgi:hypothetical protein